MLQLRELSKLSAFRVNAVDGEVGRITDFIFDETSWILRYLDVDTKSWTPGKKVLIPPNWCDEIDWSSSVLSVDLELKKIETSPYYDPSEDISEKYELELFKHYGR